MTGIRLRGGTAPGGTGDGSGAFGAVLKQGDDASKGLFIYGDETDPSWHLRGVERQLEEAAIRSHLVYENAAETARLLLHFGDDSTNEKRFRVLGGTSGDLPEEVNSQYRVTHRQHPDPSALFASYEVNSRLTVRARTAGAAGNDRLLRMAEGTRAIAARDALFPNFIQGRLNNADVNAGTLAVETGSHADGNGVEFSVIAGTSDVAGVASSVEIPQATGGNTAVLAVAADRTGTAFNGTQIVLRRPQNLPAVKASGRLNFNLANSVWVDIEAVTGGIGGNGFTVTLAYDSSLSDGSAQASYTNATTLAVRGNGQLTGPQVAAAINAARHNGAQLVTTTGSTQTATQVLNSSYTSVSVSLSGGGPGSTEPVGNTTWDSSAKILTVAIAATSTAQQIVGWINAVAAFPGTAAVEGIAGGTAARVGTYVAAGGVDAVVGTSRTVTWDATGGAASKGRLTFATNGTETVLQAVDAINASSYPGSALVTSSATGAYPISIQSMIAAGGSDAVAREPLRATQDLVVGKTRLIVSGILPGVDTIATLISTYEAANTNVNLQGYAFVGTGTDFILAAAEAVSPGNTFLTDVELAGGRDQLTKEAVAVTLDGVGHNAVQWGVRLYGSNTPAALRTTLGELRDAWTSYAKQAGADYPQAVLTGEATEVVDVDNLPAAPVGGSNYIPPSPIEFLVRDEDEADGKNIEVRYHHDHDTLQEILDASLVTATNPGGAKVIEIFGTDLTVAPEEPPVTRPMYPEGGTTTTTGGQTAAQVRDTVAAFLEGGTNITIARSGNTLTITSTATGGGGTGGLDAEAVRDTVAAFLRGTPSSAITFTHDDAGNTLTLAIAESTEAVPGLVRNVSIDEAGHTGGTVYRAWSAVMLTKLMALFRSNVSQAEAEAGTSTNLRWWSALRVRQAIEAFTSAFTAAEKTKLGGIPGTAAARGQEAQQNPSGTLTGRQKIAYRSSIDAAGEDDIPESLMELLHSDLSSAVSSEQRIGDFTLLNDGNVVYLITVGTVTEFFAGDDISALREADAHMLDGVTVYSNAGRELLIKQPNNTSREVKVWLVDDVEAFAMIAARFLPTVTAIEAQAAIDASTSRQRRIFTVERVIQAIQANRDGEAFIGASEANGEITLTRRSGTNPVDLPITGAGGTFELRQIGNRLTVTTDADGALTLVATGITPPAMDDDEVLYIRFAGPGDNDPPAYGVMRGATYNALTEKTAGSTIDTAADTFWERITVNGVTSFYLVKTASGELLFTNDTATAPYWIEVYRVEVGQGGSPGSQELVAGTPANPWAFDFRANSADGRVPGTLTATAAQASAPINFRDASGTIRPMTVGDFNADTLYNVEVNEADPTPRTTSPIIVSGSEILARAGLVTGTAASGTRDSAAANLPTEYQVPAIRLGFFRVKASASDPDSDSDQVVLRASGVNFAVLIRRFLTAGGTTVEANPAGTDGATLNRLRVQGKNYNLPGAGVIAGVKASLNDVASASLSSAYTGAFFKPTLTGARWSFGGFTLDGDKIVIPADGLYQIHTEILFNGTGGWNLLYTRFRIERDGSIIAASASEGTGLHRGSSSISEIVAEHDDWHLLQAGDKIIVDFRSVDTENYSIVGNRSFFAIVGFHSTAHVAPVTPDHNRYIGWSAAQNPTAAEFGAGSTETDDTLAVPALPAQFSTAGGAYVWFALPKTQGRPTGVYRSGNTVNQIGAFTQVNDWTPQGGSPHYVYATNREQSATALMGASYRIEYGG